ncbi:MAG: DUF354 domain-containing protein, partial [Thermoleophilia bacterium]|nr:DUF354 domain-containing protein [Thermoleophilia bacterium]
QPANHVAFRCASLVAVPDVFPLDALRRQGADPAKVWRYPGLKEEMALAGFVPDPGYLRAAGIDDSRPVVVVRPPADMALYHRFENPLFARLLERLSALRRADAAIVVLLPRTSEQAASIAAEGFADLVWGGPALDGRQLIAGAGAVVSAGGSMNREAAVLGTPAYSIYAGKLAAVDRALVAQGRLTLLGSPEECDAFTPDKKPGPLSDKGARSATGPTVTAPPAPPAPPAASAAAPVVGRALLEQFVDKILETARG